MSKLFVIQCVESRFENAEKNAIIIAKDAEVFICMEKGKGAMGTFLEELSLVNDRPFIHLEDDVDLCDNFVSKINEALAEVGEDEVTQFFTLKKSVKETKKMSGSTYCQNQCVFIPSGMSSKIIEYYEEWKETEVGKANPTAMDYLIRDYLKDNKLKYNSYIPNLVQHQEVKSVINPRRSTKRQSEHFID